MYFAIQVFLHIHTLAISCVVSHHSSGYSESSSSSQTLWDFLLSFKAKWKNGWACKQGWSRP